MDKDFYKRKYKILRKFINELLFCQRFSESTDTLEKYIDICIREEIDINTKNAMHKFHSFLRYSLSKATNDKIAEEIEQFISYENNLLHLENFLK